jgi:hypothetical protein
VALPFGTFERTLKDKANAGAAKTIAALQKQLVSIFGQTRARVHGFGPTLA